MKASNIKAAAEVTGDREKWRHVMKVVEPLDEEADYCAHYASELFEKTCWRQNNNHHSTKIRNDKTSDICLYTTE